MSDISRSGMSDIVIRDDRLRKQYITISINEKKNQIKQLDVTLDKMKSVEIKRIELMKETLAKEIQALSAELNKKVVNAEIINKKEGK